MSLFDIIKYSNTDLSELRDLPDELFNLYFSKSWAYFHGSTPAYLTTPSKHNILWRWNYYASDLQTQHFKEALSEYNNESV